MTLPLDYIDPFISEEDKPILETFYKACRSEGGTADEIHVRGLKAVLAQFGNPAFAPLFENVARVAEQLRKHAREDWVAARLGELLYEAAEYYVPQLTPTQGDIAEESCTVFQMIDEGMPDTFAVVSSSAEEVEEFSDLLARPEPVKPSAKEIDRLWNACGRNPGLFARAILASYGNH